MKYKRYLIAKFLSLLFKNPILLYNKIASLIKAKNVPALDEAVWLKLYNTLIQSDNILIIFNSVQTGGSKSYLNNLIANNSPNQAIMLIESKNFLGQCTVTVYYKQDTLTFKTIDVFKWIKELKIDIILINHLLFNPNHTETINKIIELKLSTLALLHVVIHDYYYLCPSITLLNYENEFCGLPQDTNKCNNCLYKFSKKSYSNDYIRLNLIDDINNRRNIFLPLLNDANQIITPSEYTATLFLKIYPQFKDNIRLMDHDLSYLASLNNKLSYVPLNKTTNITIGILGEITPHKGSYIIYEMIKLAKQQELNINWLVIGDITPCKRYHNLRITRGYKVSQLPDLINNYCPDIFVIPSIWPETFCYTASEIMHFNLPVFSFDVGAHSQRVANYKYGVVVSQQSALAMLDKIKEYCRLC